MNVPLEEWVGGMVVCGEACLGMGPASRLPSCDKSLPSSVDDIPREGTYDS